MTTAVLISVCLFVRVLRLRAMTSTEFVAGKVLLKDAVNSVGTYNISTSELKQMSGEKAERCLLVQTKSHKDLYFWPTSL